MYRRYTYFERTLRYRFYACLKEEKINLENSNYHLVLNLKPLFYLGMWRLYFTELNFCHKGVKVGFSTLKEEYGLSAFVNIVLRKIFWCKKEGARGDWGTHGEKISTRWAIIFNIKPIIVLIFNKYGFSTEVNWKPLLCNIFRQKSLTERHC